MIIGIVIRLVISASTWHPDFRTFQFAGQEVAAGNILNLYDHINTIEDQKIRQVIVLNYPPAVYWTFGLYTFIVAGTLHLSLLTDYLIEQAGDFGNIWFSLHLLAVKSIYLFFDIGCAFLLAKLFDDPKKKLLVFVFWMFNPINLMASYMMGQFDIIAVFFSVYCLVLAKQKRFFWAALMLGIGAAYKIYPLFLVVPLMLMKNKWLDRIQIGLIAILPYIFTMLPYLSSSGYKATALLAGQSLKSFYTQIPISGGEAILLFPAALMSIYLYYYYRGIVSLWRSFLAVLLIFFIFTHTHPQWLVWVSPLLIIELISSQFKNGLLISVIFLSWFGLLFFFDPSLNVGLFAPIWPGLYNSESLWQWWHLNPDYTFFRSLLQSLFVSAAVFLTFLQLSAKSSETI